MLYFFPWLGRADFGDALSLAFADADELQKKIEQYRDRVQTLEEALRTLQANVSDDVHPLLHGKPAIEATSGSPIPRAVINDTAFNPNTSREDEEFLDAFGTQFKQNCPAFSSDS